ncbi:hypothetical protein DL768_000979 [Monosporascus sp. mg162]|nr:hypothetical protein DL768_000979 [Monosporascus sp. mg162]
MMNSTPTLEHRERQPHAKLPEKPEGTDGGAYTQTDTRTMGAANKGEDEEFEYYWQEYPADGSFLARLDWAFDICSTFRMTGWNWAIRCLPPYEVPPLTADGHQLPLSSIPNHSKAGYTRSPSRKDFFLKRLFVNVIPSYILVDLCAVLMMQDPYFIVGPTGDLPLPPNLAVMHPALLSLRRTSLSLLGILSALQLVFNSGALCLCLLFPPVLGFRTHPWHLPTVSGSFAQVLDRGLAGFWGAWWHQTFRFGFEAPARWLRLGPRGATAVAFLQSGLLHAAGSYSTVPDSRWWEPPLFFLLAGPGVLLQRWLVSRALPLLLGLGPRGLVARRAPPRWVCRLGNLAFVLAWLQATSWPLLDDFGRCGLWLFEPVPVSLFRALGYGPTGDRRVWRYDRDFLPRWYSGKHWWDSGIGI